MERAKAIQQLQQVFTILAADQDAAVAYGKENSSDFAKRTLVRTHFSLVEGLAYQLRRVTIATLSGYAGFLSPAEISLLKEESYTLNKQGEPEAKESFQKTLPMILFSIRCYAKNHGAAFKPDFSHHGWDAMQKSIAIRNRITHPKSVADLSLTDQDMIYVAAAAGWWKQTILDLFAKCKEADAYWKTKFEDPKEREAFLNNIPNNQYYT